VDEVECVVVGAGVVGLATARALALAGHEVLVLERAYTIGFETSSRNSEVIHGGLYYPAGSLKARCCVDGRQRLYAYCREHGVPHAQIGKLIVAAEESEIAGVERIAEAARANGVDDLQWLTATQAQRLEPALRCDAAVLSPSTGIIDSHALMLAIQGETEAAGAMVVLRTPVRCGRVRHDGFDLSIGGEEPSDIRCRVVVNAAGLYAPALAHAIRGIPRETIPPAFFCRGVYFTLSGRAPFRRLVYPVSPARLPRSATRRARRPYHPRSCGSGAVRAGCRVDQRSRLCRRSGARRGVLRRDPGLLARTAGRCAPARLRRGAAKDQRAVGAGSRFYRARF